MKRSMALLFTSALTLSACATTSFAPPAVNLYNEMDAGSLSRDCQLTNSAGGALERNVDGALKLTENFIAAYRCSMRAAANGRQPFEILSFLSLVGSTAAVAFGAGPNVAIAGGIGNSVFGAGNRYYAPQEQTEILSHGVDALLCIQTEAVGIDSFDSTVEVADLTAAASGSTVEVPVERQYYNMVAAALLSVERVAAQRLSRRGTFDAAGVVAEIETLRERIQAAEEARDESPPATPAELTAMSAGEARAERSHSAVLDLDVLRPRLQQCVLRAKI